MKGLSIIKNKKIDKDAAVKIIDKSSPSLENTLFFITFELLFLLFITVPYKAIYATAHKITVTTVNTVTTFVSFHPHFSK